TVVDRQLSERHSRVLLPHRLAGAFDGVVSQVEDVEFRTDDPLPRGLSSLHRLKKSRLIFGGGGGASHGGDRAVHLIGELPHADHVHGVPHLRRSPCHEGGGGGGDLRVHVVHNEADSHSGSG